MRSLVIAVGLVAAGCGKGDGGQDRPKGDPAVWADFKLDGLPVKVSAPGDARPSRIGGVVARNGKCDAAIRASDKNSPSFDNTVHNIEVGNLGGPVKEFKRKDKRDDQNWLIEWSTADSFRYESRRQVGGVTYSCGVNASSADDQACAIKICESLSPG